ncbi:mitogen-activated protein kinase kinase kinase 5-like protein [Tanacetum coccineum]
MRLSHFKQTSVGVEDESLYGQVNLSFKGSPYWMAPQDSNPDLALVVDIWSLGCIVIEMMNGKPPWSEFDAPASMFKIMKETQPIPETMLPDGKDFMRCYFVRNPTERPTATGISTFTSIFKYPALKQLAIKRGDEYGFLSILPELVKLVPSCFAIFTFEPLSLSLSSMPSCDLVSLTNILILCLILKASDQSLRKSLSLNLELS